MKTLQTPSTLAEHPSTTEFTVPVYDWEKQTRHQTVTAGGFTSNSIQTFDNHGKPSDAKVDNND